MRGNVDILCSSDIWRGGASGGWGGREGKIQELCEIIGKKVIILK